LGAVRHVEREEADLGSGTRAVTVEVPEELFEMLEGVEAEYGVTPEEYLKEALLPLVAITVQVKGLMDRRQERRELRVAAGYL
jgi:hypothetical protein